MRSRLTACTNAVLCTLLLNSPLVFGSDATGVIHSTCDMINRYQLELTEYRGHRLAQTVRFPIPGEVGLQMFPNMWVDEQGLECKDTDPCASYFSRIQIRSFSFRRGWPRLSGNFVLILPDRRKLEGSFSAKYARPPQTLICE